MQKENYNKDQFGLLFSISCILNDSIVKGGVIDCYYYQDVIFQIISPFLIIVYIMSHLKINSHVGRSFILSHSPNRCYIINKRAISVGNEGELINWALEGKTFIPLFILIPTLNHEAANLVSFGIVNTITTIFESYPNYKIVTMHQDNRLRVWNWDDGICSTISPVGLFDSSIKGVASDLGETRSVFVFSETCIYGVDIWKMTIICRIKPSANLYKVVKDNKQIVFQDTIRRIQTVDVSQITKDKWNQPTNLLLNQDSLADQMKNAYRKFDISDNIKDSQQIVLPKEFILPSEDALNSVKQYINTQHQKKQIQQLFSIEFKRQFPSFIEQIADEVIGQSCLVFINKQVPYFFFGCETGKLIGIPLMINTKKYKTIIFESKTLTKQIRFLQHDKNMLVCSLSNQRLLTFSLSSMESAISNQNKIPGDSEFVKLQFKKFVIIDTYLSSPLKYKLETYQLLKTDILHVDSLSSFQLQNKEVMILNPQDKSIRSLRGFTRENKLLAVLLMENYIGVITNNGISVFKDNERFQRVIYYDFWEWKLYNFQQKLQFKKDYHNYQNYKKQNSSTYLVDYSMRYLQNMVNYLQPKEQLIYEIFGNYNDQKIPNQQFPNFYFRNRSSTLSVEYSEKPQNGMAIIRMLRNRDRRRSWQNTSYIIHTDIRKQLDKLTSSQETINQYKTSLPFIFPWNFDQQLSSSVKKITSGDVPTIQALYSFQGIGTSFTVYMGNTFNVSNFLSSYQAMSIMDYFITICTKDINNEVSEVMFRCVQYFTKKKPENFQSLSISSLSQLTVSNSGNIVNTGCNLLISTVVGREISISKIQDYFVLNLKRLTDTKNKQLSICEICLMLTMGFTYLYSNNNTPKERVDLLINRLIGSIDLINFQKVPELVAINMKILNEGMEKWKPFIQTTKVYTLLNNLFIVYFLYDGITTVPRDDRKFNFALDSGNHNLIKRMKQVIIKTIVYISQNFSNQFLQVLKKEAVNQQIHQIYPASVVQILRQYIKSQKPTKHLGFYVQLLLKCLSPTTPQLRKYVQKNVTQTLHLMCTYKNISFNQPSQKLALVTDNHIYIYDLRTATKWRTIDLDKSNVGECVVEMSPKGSYIAVLGKQLKIWRLSNSLWSGVLGAFSQGWTFDDVMGNIIKWDQNQNVVTVQATNPANTRAFTL